MANTAFGVSGNGLILEDETGADAVTITNAGVTITPALTATLSAASSVPDAALPAEVPLTDETNTFAAVQRVQSGGATDTYSLLNNNGLELYRHATNANGPVLQMSKSRNTEASPAAVTTNDILGGFLFRGHDGTSYAAWAGVRAKSDGVPSGTSHPSRVAIEAVASGTTSLVEQLIVYGARVYVKDELEIDGALNHDGTTVGLNGATPVAQGAAIANADGTLADLTTKFNTLLAYLRSRGDIAT